MTRPDTGLPLTSGQWLHHLRACEAKGQTTVAYAKAHGLEIGKGPVTFENYSQVSPAPFLGSAGRRTDQP